MLFFAPVAEADLQHIPALQPAGWGDIVPRFAQFIASPQCEPIKLMYEQQMVGLGTTIKHSDTAWLACIIVHEDFRNRGYGNRITRELIHSLDKSRFNTIYLDATELGFPVYLKLGFQVECEYSHFLKNTADETTINIVSDNHILTYQPQWEQDILALDQKASGENREVILRENISGAKVYFQNDQVQGFYLPNLGEGLVVANTPAAGLALMQYRSIEKPNAALPAWNTFGVNQLSAMDFHFFRSSRRMFYGEKRLWDGGMIYNRISGQLG